MSGANYKQMKPTDKGFIPIHNQLLRYADSWRIHLSFAFGLGGTGGSSPPI